MPSLKRLTEINFPFLLRLPWSSRIFGTGFWPQATLSSQAANLLNKAAFPFQPTLVSQALAFKQ